MSSDSESRLGFSDFQTAWLWANYSDQLNIPTVWSPLTWWFRIGISLKKFNSGIGLPLVSSCVLVFLSWKASWNWISVFAMWMSRSFFFGGRWTHPLHLGALFPWWLKLPPPVSVMLKNEGKTWNSETLKTGWIIWKICHGRWNNLSRFFSWQNVWF